MDREDFVKKYGSIYEHSPWVADQAFGKTDIPVVMREAVEAAGHDKQLALLRAHPDLGEKLDTLTPDSTAEQQGAGLNLCSPEEFSEFHELNRSYKEKFGFPFIVAVKGMDRQAILEQFRRRIHNSQEQEFRTALDQVHRIAGFRLADLS